MSEPISSPSPLLEVLKGECVTPPPLWLMRQAGRYLPEYREVRRGVPSFLDLCLTPKLAAEVTLQPLRRFPFDAGIVFSDILIVPFALGQSVAFVEGEGPKLEPLRDDAAIARLNLESAGERLEFRTLAFHERHALPECEGHDENICLLYTSPSPRDGLLSRMPSSA